MFTWLDIWQMKPDIRPDIFKKGPISWHPVQHKILYFSLVLKAYSLFHQIDLKILIQIKIQRISNSSHKQFTVTPDCFVYIKNTIIFNSIFETPK